MSTARLGLVDDKQTGDKLYAAEVDRLGNTVELAVLALAEVAGAGCLAADDYTATAGAGLSVAISAGVAFVGAPGQRVPVVSAGGTVSSLYASDTNCIYILSNGTLVRTRDSEAAPADSVLVATATTNPTGVTAVDNAPAGRVNLLGMHAARVSAKDPPGYLADLVEAVDSSILIQAQGGKLRFQVPAQAEETEAVFGPYQCALTPGVPYHLEVDVSEHGAFGDTHYEQTLICDEEGVEANPETTRKAADRLSFTVMIHSDDAEAGTYGDETQVEFYAKGKGVWTPAEGAEEPFAGTWAAHEIPSEGATVDAGSEVTGILPPDHGGTGVNSLAALITALGLGALAFANGASIALGGTGAGNAADARANLGLGSMATQQRSAVDITGGAITGLETLEAELQAPFDHGEVSGALEIDWSRRILLDASMQIVTLGNADITLSWANAAAGRKLILKVIRTGSGNLVFPASVKWESGSAPTVEGEDDLAFLSWGTTQDGQIYGQAFA